MKKKEIKELHQKSVEELEKILEGQIKELISLRLKLKAGKLKNIRAVMNKRNDIARIKTIITEKKITEKIKK